MRYGISRNEIISDFKAKANSQQSVAHEQVMLEIITMSM
jgi:hypothetical protein